MPLQNICAAKIDDVIGILEPLLSQYVRTHADALQQTSAPVKVREHWGAGMLGVAALADWPPPRC